MMYKNLTNVKFITSSRINSKKSIKYNEYEYFINMDVVNYHSELLNYRAQNRDDYQTEALKIINIQEVVYF